jgi:TM2 domain-containing membrane protein YozV
VRVFGNKKFIFDGQKLNLENMNKSFLFFLLFAFVLLVKQADASAYTVNEKAVDQLFANATETSMLSIHATDLSSSGFSASALAPAAAQKDAVVAIVLDFFLGGLGIHRFYLGTEVLTGIGYILTCGGIFGIVPLVDFVVLIINNQNISAYVNNPKFFMWN